MKPYNLCRMIEHAKDLNCGEASEHWKIVKADEDFRRRLNVGGANREWKTEVRVPFEGLQSRDLNVNATGNAALTVGTRIPAILGALRPSSISSWRSRLRR